MEICILLQEFPSVGRFSAEKYLLFLISYLFYASDHGRVVVVGEKTNQFHMGESGAAHGICFVFQCQRGIKMDKYTNIKASRRR